MRVVNPHRDPVAEAAFRQKAEPPERLQLLRELEAYGGRELSAEELVNNCSMGIQKGWGFLAQLICAREVLDRRDGYGHLWVRPKPAQAQNDNG